MPEISSLLSLVAATIYAPVVIACLFGAYLAARRRQPGWHRASWMALAVLFAVLIASRTFGIEEALRDASREALQSSGSYSDRRSVQSMIAAFVLVIAGSLAIWLLVRASRVLRRRRDIAVIVALASGGGMLFLITLRMISLHAIDRALYGALKLNWFGDLGATALVLAAAIYYAWVVRLRP